MAASHALFAEQSHLAIRPGRCELSGSWEEGSDREQNRKDEKKRDLQTNLVKYSRLSSMVPNSLF